MCRQSRVCLRRWQVWCSRMYFVLVGGVCPSLYCDIVIIFNVFVGLCQRENQHRLYSYRTVLCGSKSLVHDLSYMDQ